MCKLMIRYVMKEDISSVLSMMEQVKEAFPGYQETEKEIRKEWLPVIVIIRVVLLTMKNW